jgi:hypothetical protein
MKEADRVTRLGVLSRQSEPGFHAGPEAFL